MKKHDANIKKGRLINFQIGIIAVISFCYMMHEVSHYTPIDKKIIASIDLIDTPYDESMGPVEVYVEPQIIKPNVTHKKLPAPIKVNTAIIPKVVDNTTVIKTVDTKPAATPLETTKTPIKKGVTVKTTKVIKTAVINNTKTVDMMPVFPGCDKYSSNNERAVCFQDKIQRMINKKFDRSIGGELGLSGVQRISLYFEINENGLVSNIKARSQYPEFIKEAKRVAGLLPKMVPAQRRGAKVKMAYNVPIVFKTSN